LVVSHFLFSLKVKGIFTWHEYQTDSIMAKPKTAKREDEQDEHDLDKMWAEAELEFRRLSGQDPKDFTVLKVEDVIGKINQKKMTDDKAGAKYRKAKEVFTKTLTCIANLGAVAAQSVSMVRPSPGIQGPPLPFWRWSCP
jgi:hypothetical protein